VEPCEACLLSRRPRSAPRPSRMTTVLVVRGPRPGVRGWTDPSWTVEPSHPHGSAGAGRSSRAVWISGVVPCLTLALLVTQVLADHHDHAVAADHLALVADPLDARLYLHVISQLCSWCATCSGRRCGLGT